MSRFIAQFQLPQRLRDVQVPREEIREVAGLVHDILAGAQAGDHPPSSEQLASMLTAAY
jgi:alcohol dehydrogenase class IV